MIRFLTRLWTGEVPLAQAVWRYAVLYGLLVNAVSSLISFAIFAKDMSQALGIAAYVAPVPYNLFVVVSVWRSADRYEGPAGRAEVVRWATFAWMIVLSLT